MELVAREENNVFEICDGIITKMSPKAFITEFLMNSVMKESNDVSVFVAQLGVWGNAIVNTLKAKGLKDSNPSNTSDFPSPNRHQTATTCPIQSLQHHLSSASSFRLS